MPARLELYSLDTYDLALQPIVSLATREVVGAEALLRERDEEGHLSPPAALITALATGVLPEPDAGRLTRWLLAACRELRAGWAGDGAVLWFNLGSAELRRPELADELAAGIGGWNGLGAQLPMPALADPDPAVRRNICALGAAGLRVAIDHVDPRQWWDRFGGGGVLDGLGMHAVVIDGAWSRAITAAPEIGVDVATLVGDAHRRGLLAIAANVETSAQAERLFAARVDQAIGYAFGGPVPRDRLGGRMPGGRGLSATRRTING